MPNTQERRALVITGFVVKGSVIIALNAGHNLVLPMKGDHQGTAPVVQGLRISLPVQGMQV